MPRATFDVNVLISGLISSHGVAARLLALARDGAFALQLSDAILDEMVEVLERDFDWSKERTAQARAYLSSLSQHVTPRVELDVVKRDPDDNSILECSLASRSDHLVTSDKDLLSIKALRRRGHPQACRVSGAFNGIHALNNQQRMIDPPAPECVIC